MTEVLVAWMYLSMGIVAMAPIAIGAGFAMGIYNARSFFQGTQQIGQNLYVPIIETGCYACNCGGWVQYGPHPGYGCALCQHSIDSHY